MLFRTLVTAALLAATAPAFAQPAQSTSATGGLSAATPTPAASKAQVKGNQNTKVICKTTGETGSRLSGHRICLPQAEWDIHDEQTRQAVDHSQVTNYGPGPH